MFLDMKKYFILLAAALLAVACNQEELQDPNGTAVEVPSNGFLAGIETKVSLEEDFSLSWEEGDQVAIWNGTELLAPYTAQTAGKTTVLLGEEVSLDLAHCAFYPYDAVVEFEGKTVTAVIPGQQTPKSGTFPFNPSVAYAAAGEQTLQFYNICGLVGFEITEAEQGVNNVVIFGNNGEDLTGTVTLSYDEVSAPKATVVKGVKSVTLQAAETFAPGTYYVAILPQEYKNGITITMNTPEGKQYKKDSKPFTLRRSHRINAMNINDGEFGEENLISNAAELQAFFNVVNADENKGAGMLGKIVDDIDLSHIDNFTPAAEFAGTLDGAYTVGEETRNYSISNTASHLIGTLSATGVVKNINVSGNIEITADDDAAFIALNNAGKISYCKTSGEAKTLKDDLVFNKERAVGAIAARTSGTIEYCTNEAAINLNPKSTAKWAAATLAAHQFVGGIAGQATGTEGSAKITNCTNAGTVTYKATNGFISSMACVGGILGGTPSVLYSKLAEWVPVNNVAISNCVNTETAAVTYGYNKDANGNAFNNVMLAGVAGYLEGTIANSSNAALIKIDGYRTTDDHSGDHYLKNTSVAGVVGVVTGDVTSCSNSGKIDFSATISSGDASAPFIGSTSYSTVAGVVAKSFKGTLSACENTGEMLIDMHMRQANGSSGVVAGVIGYSYNSNLKNCINRGACTFTTRPRGQYVGGVCALAETTTVPEKIENYGDITCDAGTITPGAGRQSYQVVLGGVFGQLKSNGLDIRDKDPFYNAGDIVFRGGTSQTSKPSDDKDPYVVVGGVCGMVSNARPRGSADNTKNLFINDGNITVTDVPCKCYVGGVHAYQSGLSASATGVGAKNGENHGNITVSTSAKLSVGGVYGYYGARCMYNSRNSGDIVVTNTAGDVRVGGVIGDTPGLQSMDMKNTGNVTVTKTGSGYVCAAGVSAAESGKLGNVDDTATPHINEGIVTLNSSAANSYLGGISAYDKATSIMGANKGDIIFTYTGDGSNNPALYASLIAGDHHGSANYRLTEVSGTLTLNNVENVKCHCGALAGYMNASGAIKTTADKYTVVIKKSAVVNGVSASLDDSFLVGTNDGGTLTKNYVSLVD